MQAWMVDRWGLEHLQCGEIPTPSPGPGEVTVEFQAASLNYRDLLVVEGRYNPKFPLPLAPCSDGFGQIVEVGNGVERSLLGRHVLTHFCPLWRSGEPEAELLRATLGGPLPGVLQQYRNFRPEELHLVSEPAALTPGEWSTLPCAGVTAWHCLSRARLKPGQTLLLLGTGGVSLFALQIGRMFGARVLLLSSSLAKRERAKELGADAVSDYNLEAWGRWALEKTDGRGVDLVMETGGAKTLPQSLTAVRVGGQIALLGVLSGHQAPLNIMPLVMKSVTVQGVVVGHHAHQRALANAYLQSMQRPVVGQSFAWQEVPQAFRLLESGRAFGNIVVEFPAPSSSSKEVSTT